MLEKLLLGFLSAALALTLRELVIIRKSHKKRQRIAAFCCEHLTRIKESLCARVSKNSESAFFTETNYSEVAVGDFLYNLIIANIDCFNGIDSINKTIHFFHGYKVNMSTVRSRLDNADDDKARLTIGTYINLLNSLDEAISELEELS